MRSAVLAALPSGPRGPLRQQGQALVLGLLLAGVASLALVRYFGVGKVVAARAKQLHALDAAAYSGALVQARALNMLAYLNRSQVAHQVAMAHLVTVASWAMLGGNQARQAGRGNPPVYLIGMLFGPDHGAAYAASRSAAGFDQMARTQGELAHAYQEHDTIVHDVLQAVQHDIVASVPRARLEAMNEVLAANYSRTSFDLTVVHDNWPGGIQLQSGLVSLAPFVREAAGLYGFLDPRNHTARNPWPVDARCLHLRHQLRRRGSTQLDSAGQWQSIDTQSFHALRSNRWIGCYYREYAMGWGWIPSAENQRVAYPYVDNPPDNFSAQDFWRWVRDATNWDIISGNANPLANSRAAAARQRWSGGGLAPFYDLDTGATPPDSALGFTVELRHPGPEELTISTRSAAQAFFKRPEPRADSRSEAANLFHPYWQARLAPTKQGGQALVEALVAMGVLVLLWISMAWLMKYQDMALQASHASRYAAFALTREPPALPLQEARDHFFMGQTHQWADQRGEQVLDSVRSDVKLDVARLSPLSGLAQAGAHAAHADGLRKQWHVADQGLVQAQVSVDPENGLYPALSRQTTILVHAGHAQGDLHTQQRVADSTIAWRGAADTSIALSQRVAGAMQAVDLAWGREAVNLDWLTPWSGMVPARHTMGETP